VDLLQNWRALKNTAGVDSQWEETMAAEWKQASWCVACGNYRIQHRRDVGANLLNPICVD
jgi:hypothetical protein